jgi:pyrroline-5-carboxylate reductase
MSDPVLLVGCGKMGGAMLRGWLARGLERAVVIEPQPAQLGDLAKDPRLAIFADAAGLPEALQPTALVLAIKPQSMDTALGSYRALAGATVTLSIAAGKTLSYLGRHLGAVPIVRAMPNLPASIGRGMTVAVANPQVTPPQRALAEWLLAACGDVAWVDEEQLLDPVTAVSGSGPAYVFLLIETLARAGEHAGLPPELAMRLARTTLFGAADLAEAASESAATLRANVTSPGGTTQAALEVLMGKEGLQPLFDRAIQAATRRSRELGK